MSKIHNPWSQEDLTQLKTLKSSGQTNAQIAASLGRTEKQVSSRLWALRKTEKVAANAAEPREAYWRKEATAAHRRLAKAGADRTAVEILVERVMEVAPIAYTPPAYVKQPLQGGVTGHPQSAVLMLSDTHAGKVTLREQTLGLGEYNFNIFLRRLQRLEDAVASITSDHITTELPEIVVPMIGDMLDGALNHSAEMGQENTLFTQFYAAGHALAQFLRNISVIAPIRVYTAVGNHTRWGTQRKMPTTNRYSNLDQFLYAYIAALLRDCPRVKFNLDQQPFALFKVQGFNFLAAHGDHLHGGDYILGVPNHAIGRSLSSTSQNFGAAGKDIPHYYLTGHLHRPITLPHTRGEFLVNGGFPGTDGFGLMTGFCGSAPSQKFFLVHPRFGKSASYDIRLDFGDTTPHRYQLPPEFPVR